MARIAPAPVQQYRGTTAQHQSYTGPAGELTVDTTKKAVVVHDGTTAGGITMAREDRQISVGSGLVIGASDSSATLASDFTIGVDMANLISAKANNILEVADGSGEDGKLYVAAVEASDLVASSDELLWIDGNGKIASGLDMAYNTTTGKFDLTNHNGDIIATVTVPSSVSMLQNAELVVNPSGQPTGTYLHFVFNLADGTTRDLYVDVTSLIDIYTAGNGIDITGNAVSVKLASGGGLEFDGSGNVQAQVSSTAGNNLSIDANGLFVPTPAAVTVVSTDADNMISAGTDGGALLTCADARSTATGNQIVCNSNKLFVTSDYGTMD